MNLEEVKYDAFISYRHCELDQFVAVNLHKEMEAFRLPKAIKKQLQEKGIEKRKIERVFRDRDELPITNNLADPITNALRNSEFLLVICSPRLPQSLWCKKEIETFIQMHGREKIFAVLIEGEPDESFPEELLYEEKTITDEQGNTHIERVPIEPLAADVRGKNKAEIKKKIKEEVLRLAAPMFGCSYDDLKQRHRERRLRRILAAACAACVVFGSFGVISTTMALRIQKQSEQIKQQSEQIEIQYQEALRTNARQMAEDAFAGIESGDLAAAIETSYNALTQTAGADMPYTAEAEYALSSALQVYRNGSQITPQRILEQDSQVNFFKLSPDGKSLMVVDIFGNLVVYEPLAGSVLFETALEGSSTYLSEERVNFIGNTEIVYPTEEGFALYNFETEELREYESNCSYFLQADKGGNYLLTMCYDELVVYALENMKPVYSMKTETGVSFHYTAAFSNEFPGKIAIEYERSEEGAGLYLLDVLEQTCSSFLTDAEAIMSIRYDENDVYLSGYEKSDDLMDSSSIVYCIDLNGNKKWEYHTEGIADHLFTFGETQIDKLAFEHYSTLTVLNKEDGTLLAEEDLGREIVGYCGYENSNILTAMTREGSYYYYTPENDMAVSYIGKVVSHSDNLKDFQFGKGYYVSVEHLSNAVVVYDNAIGSGVNQILQTDYILYESKMSQDGNYLVMRALENDYKTFLIVSLKDTSNITEIVVEDYISDFAINENGELVVLFVYGGVERYNLENGQMIEQRMTTTENSKFVKDGSVYIGIEDDVVYLVDVMTGDVLSQIEEARIVDNGILASTVDAEGHYYAYSDEEQKQIVIGSFEEDFSMQIPININVVDFLTIAPQEKAIYVTYLDETVESYDITTGNLIRNYGILEGGIENIIELTSIGQTILQSSTNAYLLNEEKEVIAFLQGFTDYSEEKDTFILQDDYKVYEAKRLELTDLLEEAEEIVCK